jgi:hypothetical protein
LPADFARLVKIQLNLGIVEQTAFFGAACRCMPFCAKLRSRRKENVARRWLFNSNLMIFDQVAINTGFDFAPSRAGLSVDHV